MDTESKLTALKFAAWFLANPVLFGVGFLLSRPRLLGKLQERFKNPLRILSLALGVYFGFFWLIPGLGVRNLVVREVLLWSYVASVPLCCFLKGLEFGVDRKKERILVFEYIVLIGGCLLILFLAGLFAYEAFK